MQGNIESNNDTLDFDSSNLLLFIVRWKKPLLIVAVITTLLSGFFSSSIFIAPKFKSTVIMFPTVTGSISESLKEGNLAFGEEEEAEQLLQVLNSDEIRQRIVEKYNLLDHYDIDTTDVFGQTKLFKEYENNVTYKRTEFQSVRVDVLDVDPQMAADIANDIAGLVDTVKNRIQNERAVRAMNIAKGEYLALKHYIEELDDSLDILRDLGVNDYESMAERFNEYYAKAILEGNTGAEKKLAKKLEILSKYGGAYVSLRDVVYHEKVQLSQLRSDFQEAKMDAEEKLPHKFIVNTAFPAEKKSYPIRWLIVLVSTISTCILALLVIIIYENITKAKN